MYLLYMDASGTPELSDPNGSTFVLGGVCLHETAWVDLDAAVADLKSDYSLPGETFELHAKDLCVGYKEQDEIEDFESLSPQARRSAVVAAQDAKIHKAKTATEREQRRKKYRGQRQYAHLTRGERTRLYEDALDLVGTQDGIRLFAEVVDKKYAAKALCLQDAFAQVVSRFDFFLGYKNRSPRFGDQRGLLVMDNEPTYQGYIESIHNQFRTTGHPWGKIDFVIESPFFIDSAKASGVQVVDLCTYAVRRYIEYGLRPGKIHEERNFRRIFHKFDRAGPKLHGLRHYCRKGSCPCLICRERDHAASEVEADEAE